MRRITKIYVHCTASEWGTVEEVTRWHLERGWQTIGYHGLVTNLFPTYSDWKDHRPQPEYDGKFWPGRAEFLAGAHVYGDNLYTLGYALVGNENFSQRQLDTMAKLCASKCLEYKLDPKMVRGHREYWEDQGKVALKSCPNLSMDFLRNMITGILRVPPDPEVPVWKP